MSRGKERVRTEESSLETTEAAQTGTEELYQRQRGSRWELFCQYWIRLLTSVASGDRKVKEWCGQSMDRNFKLKMSEADHSTLNFIKPTACPGGERSCVVSFSFRLSVCITDVLPYGVLVTVVSVHHWLMCYHRCVSHCCQCASLMCYHRCVSHCCQCASLMCYHRCVSHCCQCASLMCYHRCVSHCYQCASLMCYHTVC